MQLVRMADILFAERMKNIVGEWRSGLLQGGNWGSEFQGSSNDTSQKFQTTFFETRPALVVNGLTSRQLKLIKLVNTIFLPFSLIVFVQYYLIQHRSNNCQHCSSSECLSCELSSISMCNDNWL